MNYNKTEHSKIKDFKLSIRRVYCDHNIPFVTIYSQRKKTSPGKRRPEQNYNRKYAPQLPCNNHFT